MKEKFQVSIVGYSTKQIKHGSSCDI